MPTKKKVTGRDSREVASPRVSRQQKKHVENVQVQAKKVAEIITASARKKKVVVTVSRAIEEPIFGTNLDTKFRLEDSDDTNVYSGYNTQREFDNSLINNDEGHEDGIIKCVTGTIFSPSFHIARNNGAEIFSGGGGAHLPEVSEIYLSTRSSNLECVEVNNQDYMSTNVCQDDDDDGEEADDFDPYFFIKNLPDLSSVVPSFRPVLLPKQTRSCPSTTLVLDLDETLVHSTLELCDDADFTFSVNFNLKKHPVYVRCRPHLMDFLERVSRHFEIIIFTASQSIYAEKLLNVLDPKKKIFRHRVYRESCVFLDGNYLKDLSVLGRDLTRVIIVDNSPQAFGFQVENGIPIESWFDDRADTELLTLLPFLESLIGVQDVRPLISQKYNLREKIAAAVCPLDEDPSEQCA